VLKNKTITQNRNVFAVIADRQQSGRGTRGRSWQSQEGNLLITIGIKRSKMPVPLQYLPLRLIIMYYYFITCKNHYLVY
jgi:biotin-(acetyl-CoA carboxylase) ligase